MSADDGRRRPAPPQPARRRDPGADAHGRPGLPVVRRPRRRLRQPRRQAGRRHLGCGEVPVRRRRRAVGRGPRPPRGAPRRTAVLPRRRRRGRRGPGRPDHHDPVARPRQPRRPGDRHAADGAAARAGRAGAEVPADGAGAGLVAGQLGRDLPGGVRRPRPRPRAGPRGRRPAPGRDARPQLRGAPLDVLRPRPGPARPDPLDRGLPRGVRDDGVRAPAAARPDRLDGAAQPDRDVADGDDVRHARRGCRRTARSPTSRPAPPAGSGWSPSARPASTRCTPRRRAACTSAPTTRSPRTAGWSTRCTSTAPGSSRRSCTPGPTGSAPRCTASPRSARR